MKIQSPILLSTALFAACLSPTQLLAQPSDAQIIKDLTWKGVKKVELSKTTTKKGWSRDQYLWTRGATIWSEAGVAEYPNATLVQYGYANYHYGESNTYRDFSLAETTYEGIPAPSKEEILGLIKERYANFLDWRFHAMVGDLHYLRFAEEEGVIWHTPNSFTAMVEMEYDHKTSYTQLTTTKELAEVRFYRPEVSGAWQDHIVASSKTKEDVAVKDYTQEEIDAMPTLSSTYQEKEATAAAAAMPEVNIPAFNTDVDVFLHTHKMLREASKDEMHAYLLQMLAPSYFAENSTTRLNANGERLLNKVLDAAFSPKSTYAQQYCPDPGVKHQQSGMMEWWNATQDKKTRCTVGMFGGGWKNGQKVGETFKITDLEVWLWTDADNIARINSYEPGMLCKNAGASGSGPSQPTESTQPAQQESSGSKLMNTGKGLWNKVKQN